MCITRNIVGVLAVATMAFAAGRSDLFTTSAAQAQQPSKNDRSKGGEKPQATPSAETLERLAIMERVGTPGKGHEVLEPAIGIWNAAIRIRMNNTDEWMESKGTIKREWVLGKRFIRETVHASGLGPDSQPYDAIAYIGYNNFDRQYEIAWMDSVSTAMIMETGSYDPDTKVMKMRSSHRDPETGRVIYGHGSWDMANNDRHTFVGFATGADGGDFKNFEGVFERNK